MPIPDFQNLMLPMLQLVVDGAERRLSDVLEALAQQFDLTDADRAELLPGGGQARFDNKVGWARTHLGKAGLLERPRRGWLRITERGREVLADPPARITVAYDRRARHAGGWRRDPHSDGGPGEALEAERAGARGAAGARRPGRARAGMIITTSDFSTGARDEAARPDATPVALMNGEQLVTLLIEHDIGVRRSRYDLIELGEDEG